MTQHIWNASAQKWLLRAVLLLYQDAQCAAPSKETVFKIVALWCLSALTGASRFLLQAQTAWVRAANSNSEIAYFVAHGAVRVLVRAWRERREGGIRFSSPEIRRSGGASAVRPPPAVLGSVMEHPDSSGSSCWLRGDSFKSVFAEKINYMFIRSFN